MTTGSSMDEVSAARRSFLVAERLSWQVPGGELLLSDISLSVGPERTGLVGRNGAGKSTLLRLLLGELTPGEGKVRIQGKVAYLPQGFILAPELVVADALGVQARLRALERITAGSCDPEDFTTLDDDWNVMERTRSQLEELGLGHLELERRMATLSGGETTRVLLARLLLQGPDVLLLDEPTNNLDARSREALYQLLARWRGGALVVTHDRELLMHVDRILELSTLGLKAYGGNYEAYLEQKEVEEEAALRRLKDAQKTVKKTQREIQEARERHQQREAQGRHLRKTGSQSKLFLNAQRERSEQSKSGLAIRAERQLEAARKELNESRGQVELLDKGITVALEATEVPRRKLVLELRDVGFTWPGGSRPMLDGLNLTLVGPERMCLAGSNGSGKTTLTRLILGQLQPERGTVKLGVEHVAYLDQHARLLDDELSILENFRRYNPRMMESDRRLYLAHFLFRNEAALQRVGTLSGGERLRAALACALVSERTPQLLILDEPTNHLDLDSIESIERILQNYQGALLVISHDQRFLENIQVTSTLNLDSLREAPRS